MKRFGLRNGLFTPSCAGLLCRCAMLIWCASSLTHLILSHCFVSVAAYQYIIPLSSHPWFLVCLLFLGEKESREDGGVEHGVQDCSYSIASHLPPLSLTSHLYVDWAEVYKIEVLLCNHNTSTWSYMLYIGYPTVGNEVRCTIIALLLYTPQGLMHP